MINSLISLKIYNNGQANGVHWAHANMGGFPSLEDPGQILSNFLAVPPGGSKEQVGWDNVPSGSHLRSNQPHNCWKQ